MSKFVSIILVNYNGTEETNACIRSLLRIDYDNFNIIVVDNGSTEKFVLDSDLDAIKRVTVLFSDTNLGFSGGNNLGIKYCINMINPDYYLLLNNDTEVEPHFLKALMNCASKNAGAAIICGKIYYYSNKNILWYAGGKIDLSSGWTKHFGSEEEDNGKYDYERDVTFATGCLMLLPKWTIEKCGLLEEKYFLYFEDTDYCCRVQKQGYKIYYCPACVIYHKVNASTKKNGKVFTYYFVRSSLMFIRDYGTNKAKGYSQHIYQYIKDIIRGRSKAGIVMRAIMDFMQHKDGFADL